MIQLEQLIEEMMGRKATVVREGETVETRAEGERDGLRGAREGRRWTAQLKGGRLVKEIKDGHRGEESEQTRVAIKGIDLLPLGREENVGELRRRNTLKARCPTVGRIDVATREDVILSLCKHRVNENGEELFLCD